MEGEGCFTFMTQTTKYKDGGIKKYKIPAFVISMHERDEELLRSIRNKLGLKNMIYHYKKYEKNDGYNHGRMSSLVVRDRSQFRNIIIPLFYKRLHGYKGRQFENWIENIGTDEMVPESYKYLYLAYKGGFFDKNLELVSGFM